MKDYQKELVSLCNENNIKLSIRNQQKENPTFLNSNSWKVAMTYEGKTCHFNFWTGFGLGEDSERFKYDCLYDVCMNSQYMDSSFEEFCDEFGYDSDSIKALNIYKEVVNVGKKVRKLFGYALINQIAAIEY